MLRLLPVTALFDVQVIYMAEYSTRARPKPVCAPDGAWLSAVNGNDCLLNTAQQPSSARTPRARARTPHAAMMILDDRRSACVRAYRAALRELAWKGSVCEVSSERMFSQNVAEIGIGLTAVGVLFLLLGVLFLFDNGFLGFIILAANRSGG